MAWRQNAAGELVLQIAAQNAVFDQHIALRLVAFVVHVQRAAPAADGAVVHHRAERARHLLPDAAAERRHAFAVEIGFEPMAHRFMQQHAGPSRTEHHNLLAGRRFHRVQLHDRLARRFAREILGRALVLKPFELVRPPPPACPCCGTPSPSRASASTLMRASGCRSKFSMPSLVATSTWRRLSA